MKLALQSNQQRIVTPLISFVLSVIITLGCAYVWVSAAGKSLDNWLLSQFFVSRGERQVNAPIIIIAIDDESYAELKASPRWPFPKRHLAAALDQLTKAKPKLVVVDDSMLAQLGESTTEESLTSQQKVEGFLVRLPIFKADSILPKNESDSLIVKLKESQSELTPLIQALEVYGDEARDSRSIAPTTNALINYYGPKGTVNRVPLSSVLKNTTEQNQELFTGKVVFIGFQGVVRERGQITKEEERIPFGSGASAFGVEIKATIAANLLERDWIERADSRTEFFLVLGGCFLFTTIGVALVPTRSVPALSLLLGGLLWFAFSRFAAVNRPFWIAGVPVFIIAALSSVVLRSVYHAATVRHATEKLKKAYRVDI